MCAWFEVLGGFWVGSKLAICRKLLELLEPPAGIEPATC